MRAAALALFIVISDTRLTTLWSAQALGYKLSDECDEFLLPGQLVDEDHAALAAVILELRALGAGAEAGAEVDRKSVVGMLRRSFGGGARRDDFLETLIDNSERDVGEQLTRTNSAGAALARGFSGIRTTLGRTLSSGAGGVQEFNCPICMCNESVTESFTLACGHRFCRECVVGYITSKINDAQLQMTCPDLSSADPVFSSRSFEHDDREAGDGLDEQLGCPLPVDTTIIRLLVDAPTRAKHDRFAAISSNPLLRECPADGCTTLVQPTINWRGVIKPDMTCSAPGCSQQFCYFHSAAHPGRTCRQYLLRSITRDQQLDLHSIFPELAISIST